MKFDVDKALSHKIVMISGEEDLLRRRALNELVSAASQGDEFDTETFYADASTVDQWLGSCGTTPFLSPRRVAIVRNLLRADIEDPLPTALPESAMLILVVDGEISDDKKEKANASRLRKWDSAVKKAGGMVYSATLSGSAFDELIKQEAAKLGKTITSGAVKLLQDMLAGNVSSSIEELEKAALYIGNQSQITERDIDVVVLPAREWSIFKLLDSILAGHSAEALGQLKILLGGNSKVETPAFSTVLPMMTRQFRLMWQGRAMLDAKASLTSPPEALKDAFPTKANLFAQKEYPQRLALQSAEKVTWAQLQRCFEIMVETESRMKGLLPAWTASDTLEQMVLELIATVKARPATS